MRTWAIIGILVLCVGLGCASQKLNITNIEDFTLESFTKEATKNLKPDDRGWRVLGIPDKDFDTNVREFVLFTKDSSWGAGFLQQMEGGGIAVVLYAGETKTWYYIENGYPMECTFEVANAALDSLWELMKEHADFAKIRPFQILRVAPKESI